MKVSEYPAKASSNSDPLAAIPVENLRQLHELAKREKELQQRQHQWAKYLGLFFSIAIALFLIMLFMGMEFRP